MIESTLMYALYAWLAVGLCAMVLGFFGMMARRPGASTRPWLAPLSVACAAGIAAAGAAVSGHLAAASPPALLALVSLSIALLRAGPCQTTYAALVHLSLQPRAQAFAMMCFGAAVVGLQSWLLSRGLEDELHEADKHLAAMAVPNLEQYPVLVSETDGGSPVPLWKLAPGEETDGSSELEFLRRSQFGLKLIQTDGPDPRYNCHGWVFAGGKAWIRGSSVDQILRENNYQPTDKPSVGNVAVFRDPTSGDPTHTALVIGFRPDGTILLESKWGKLGRYIHTAKDHIYSKQNCTYYKTPRDGGHVLKTVQAD